MSHFTRIKTQIVEKDYLLQSLRDLGHDFEEGNIQIRGYSGNQAQVNIKIPTENPEYDIGFVKAGNSYDIVADWWGIKGIDNETFHRQLMQRYAYNATRAKLEEQGFFLADEEVQEDNRIHLVLRRVV
jgi:hypothetical protein